MNVDLEIGDLVQIVNQKPYEFVPTVVELPDCQPVVGIVVEKSIAQETVYIYWLNDVATLPTKSVKYAHKYYFNEVRLVAKSRWFSPTSLVNTLDKGGGT